MEQNKIQWTYIPNTNKAYLLFNDGTIFSKYIYDFIEVYENKQGTQFYKLTYENGSRVVSVNKLLSENFE